MSFLEIFKSVDINKELNRCRTTKGAILLDVRRTSCMTNPPPFLSIA